MSFCFFWALIYGAAAADMAFFFRARNWQATGMMAVSSAFFIFLALQ